MYFGSPEFVLAIIGMAMFAGVLKSAIRAKHGYDPDNRPYGGRRHRGRQQANAADVAQIADLRSQNARLSERLEAYEDRLIVLEKIVTDGGYDLAHQIEALRDREPKLEDRSEAR